MIICILGCVLSPLPPSLTPIVIVDAAAVTCSLSNVFLLYLVCILFMRSMSFCVLMMCGHVCNEKIKKKKKRFSDKE